MKKTIILLSLFLTFGISAQEIFMLQPVNIDPVDSEKFEMIEKKYATIMAQQMKTVIMGYNNTMLWRESKPTTIRYDMDVLQIKHK